jgi:predicted MFS family arabinose efflux permease
LFATCVSAVALMTFLPIDAPSSAASAVALLCFGLAATLTRWRVGVSADRWGLGVMFAASLLAVCVGMEVVAFALTRAGGAFAVSSAIGCVVAGLGYGGVQSLSLVAALRRVADSAVAGASAVWNIAFDAGLGLCALAIGITAGAVGMALTFVLCAMLLVAFAPLANVVGRARPG